MRGAEWGLVWVSVLIGCGDPPPSLDAGLDASRPLDAGDGRQDARSRDAGTDGGPPADSGVDVGADAGCGDCADEFLCTIDTCGAAGCDHAPNHLLCESGERCDPTRGCVGGDACVGDSDCERPDTCLEVRCDPATRRCLYSVIDGDGDRHHPVICRGDDCDDSRSDVHPGVDDYCDGMDADCSGGLDAVDAPGCSGPAATCDGRTCVCLAPGTECPGFPPYCVDLMTDRYSCGSCGRVCYAIDEYCEAGDCRCAPDHTRCDDACADLTSDPRHCGDCSTNCGEAMCADSACECAAGEVYCPRPFGGECADFSNDARHCGGCGLRCMAHAVCSSTLCDVRVGPVLRGYVQTYPGIDAPTARSFAVDSTTGAVFGWVNQGPGDVFEVGGTGARLYTGGSTFVGFGTDGSFRWAVPTTFVEGQVFADGGHVYALASSFRGSETYGTATVGNPSGVGEFVVAMELDPVTGALLASVVLPARAGGRNPGAVTSTGRLVLSVHIDGTVDLGGGPLPPGPPGDHHSVVAVYRPGMVHHASWRVPGGVTTLLADPSSNVVAHGRVFSTPITFGGDTFTVASEFVVRYTLTGAHLQSLVNAYAHVAMNEGVLAIGSLDPFVWYYPYSGVGTSGVVVPPLGVMSLRSWYPSPVVADGTHVYFTGPLEGPAMIAGRSIPATYSTMFARLDRTTLAVDRIALVERFDVSTIRDHNPPGYVNAMALIGPQRLRVVGDLTGTLQFGSRTLTPGMSDSGFYIADIDWSP